MTIIFCSINSNAQNTKNITIWQIGESDQSASEFALARNNYEDFVPAGFGGANSYYVVGKSTPINDWPYILPGPFDGFAGYGYWSGRALHQLPIYFELKNITADGFCTLIIDIMEVSSEHPPLFRALINGKAYNHQLKPGKSGNIPKELNANPQSISFSFPTNELIKGINEIVFQNMTGSWCVFDAIRMEGPKDLIIRNPGNTILKSVAFAVFEMDKSSKSLQPLLLDLLQQDNHALIKVVVDNKESIKTIEPGHSILEFYFPAVSEERWSDVKIFIDGKLKFDEQGRRFPAKRITLSDYVDQFMGTSGSRWLITPGPRHPMPMVQLGPNNEKWVWKAGYEYQIENISGFNHTQEWTMAGFLMMPTVGVLQTQPGSENNPDLGYRSRISKETEKAKIGKYSVDLLDYNIHVDLTATTRAGFQRYIFPKSDNSRVLIDAYPPAEYTYQNVETEITRIGDTKIEGYVHHICDKTGYMLTQDYKLYFVLEFNKPFKSVGAWTDEAKELDKLNHGVRYDPIRENIITIKGAGNIGAFINFMTCENDTILVRSAISMVSTKNAWQNLKTEISDPFDWGFEQIVQNQIDTWEDYLGRIEIETDDYLQKVKFYTNLYRALSGRVAWGDVNGEWVDMNEEVQTFNDPDQRLCSGEFWNTFWNVQQLFQLIAPEFSSMQVKSLIEFYDKGGWLSKGISGGEYTSVMVAEHGIPWIVGAWNAGIRDFDFNKAYQAMYHVQTTPPIESHSGGSRVGNESLVSYMKYGYVPLNDGVYQSYVSNTLEYAFDDWCLAQAAKMLNKDDDYKLFMKRSENWHNIFDPKSAFMRPKNADGSWYEPFNPYRTPGFVEGNSWQFSWFVPHDMQGLVNAIGKERFISRLDSAMNVSQKVNFNALGDNFSKYPINHGNQPNMQSCYLFSGASTQPFYELGSPRFKKITIHLSNKYYGGNTFVIEAKNASNENKYIQSVNLNGKKLNSWRFPQKELIKGGRMIIEMGNKQRQSSLNPPERLRVSNINPHLLETHSGTPVFLNNYTAWSLIGNGTREDIAELLKICTNQKFNMISVVLPFYSENNDSTFLNNSSFICDSVGLPDPLRPIITPGNNPEVPDEYDFWDHVDYTIDQTAEKGMYISLHPTWGNQVSGGYNGSVSGNEIIFNTENAYQYGLWLGQRYGGKDNLLWMLGGDRSAVYKLENGIFDYRAVWRAMAEGLADGANDENKHDGKADYSNVLISFHPRKWAPNSSEWFHNDPWLSFNSIQDTPYDQLVSLPDDYRLLPTKPTWLFEGRYEGRINAWGARYQAYQTVFAGGFLV